MNRNIITKSHSDSLVRSLIRHDSTRLAALLIDMVETRMNV